MNPEQVLIDLIVEVGLERLEEALKNVLAAREFLESTND